jgi:hypothetical protein
VDDFLKIGGLSECKWRAKKIFSKKFIDDCMTPVKTKGMVKHKRGAKSSLIDKDRIIRIISSIQYL